MANRKLWMIDPFLYKPDENGAVFPRVELEPSEYHDYEADPEYIQIEVPEPEGD